MPASSEAVQRLRIALSEASRAADAILEEDDPCKVARLCRVERACVECLIRAGQRCTLPQLREVVEARLAEPVAEGMLKAMLARMTAPEVNILHSDRSAHPPGYQLTPAFLSLFPVERIERLRTSAVRSDCA